MCVGWLFPALCVVCGIPGEHLCKKCYKEILPLICQYCPQCRKKSDHGVLCSLCFGGEGHLDGLWVGAEFARESVLRQVIHAMKYAGRVELVEPLVDRLWAGWAPDGPAPYVVMPVPLHRRRREERGYNQAALLGRAFAQRTGYLYREDLLQRWKYTQAQAKKSGTERREAMGDAFCVQGAVPARILLVDDVATTGATLEGCARVLKAAGAEVVQGLVLARGTMGEYTKATFASPTVPP